LLCVASHHFKPEIVISGGVDKQLVVSDWKRKIKLCVFEASAPVLDVAFNPKQEYGDYIVATFMDAKHSLLRLENHDGIWKIEQLFSFHDHNRHGAMKVAWSHDGVLFATGSSDKSLNVYKCSDLNNSTKLPSCEKFKSFFFNGTVEAIVFVPPSNVGVPEYLVVSVRDDCYMHYIDCNTFEKERYANEVLRNKSYSGANSSCSCDGLNRINMNQDGIEHVSFTIMDLQVSPSGKYLLAATDTSRHFIFGVSFFVYTIVYFY
jgi:WD40 repeat protein